MRRLPAEWADAQIDADASVTEARAAAFDEIQKRGKTVPTIRVTGSNDDPAQIQTRAADALAYRMAGGELPDASREYVSMSLRDLAAESLSRSGVSTRGMSADEVFHRSLGTSDFPLVISNAMGKVAAQAYQAAESPLKALARQKTLPNFKTSTSIRIGGMGRLEEMTEHGEFAHTNRAEAVIGLFDNTNPPDRIKTGQTLPHQNLNLPQLRDNLLRLRALVGHSRSSVS